MFSLHVDYPPCFVSSKFDFTSLARKMGLNILSGHTHRGETEMMKKNVREYTALMENEVQNVTGERSGCGVVWECDRREVGLWSGMGM